MIILTGGLGFIGTNTLMELKNTRDTDIMVVDDLTSSSKRNQLVGKMCREIIPINMFWNWLEEQKNPEIEAIIHLGACSDTTNTDIEFLKENNVKYSQRLWSVCVDLEIPFIYASSAATYGDGTMGYKDDHHLLNNLKPLNAYGDSKHKFDLWAVSQKHFPPKWVGLKFFNVYGQYEDLKGRMASVVHHAIPQVRTNGTIRLFKSYHNKYEDGEQLRDFVFVKDVVNVILYFLESSTPSGIYNVGTGLARTFNDLAKSVFNALEIEPHIQYVEMPKDLRKNYQYFTEADLSKLCSAGYINSFTSLEEGAAQTVNKIVM